MPFEEGMSVKRRKGGAKKPDRIITRFRNTCAYLEAGRQATAFQLVQKPHIAIV
ncbi:hypothetical protein [Noviherbaspirillum album]|uniref:hypothetical protein n=1 Tax=Noviherbaspirillum album TaxID=3080276 RepID=UPI002DD6196E|nr:hypothetical protein [Noviherbaspirillum sp. CPCC 100848]